MHGPEKPTEGTPRAGFPPGCSRRAAVPVRSGGSIPIIATFEEVLGIKSVLMGFGLGSDAIHSPNENYPLEQFFNGITTIPLFYKYFGEIMKK